MRYIYIFFMYFCANISHAQDYPAFKFKTIKSQWDYFSIDTNYIKDNVNFQRTKYSSVFSSEFFKSGKNLYLLQSSVSPDPYIGANGYLMHNLDYRTGKLGWVLHNNTYNKKYDLSKYGQILAFNSSFVNDLGQIVVLSRVSKDTIRKNDFSPVFGNTNYAQSVINSESGQQLSFIMGSDTSRNSIDCLHCNSKLFVRSMDNYCQLWYDYLIDNDETVEHANFYEILPDMNIDTLNVKTLEYRTGIISPQPIIEQSYYYNQLNKDTFLLLNYVVYPEDNGFSPDKATLRWIDINEKNAPKEVHTLDIKPYYILPDRNFYKEQPTIWTIDNNIVLSQGIYADKANIFKGDYWILWLDAKGNTRSSVRSLRVGARIYEGIYPYTVKGDRLYLMGEYADGNEKGIDLVEVHAGTNEVRTTTNLVSYQHFKNSRRIASEAAIWIDEEYSAFGFRMYKDTTRLQSEYFYYIGVRNQDLGIISSLQKVAQTIDCTIYPNPTVDQVTLSFGLGYTGTLRLHDVHGQAVMQPIKLRETDHYDLSLAELPSGVYYLQLDDGRGGRQVVGRPLIKM